VDRDDDVDAAAVAGIDAVAVLAVVEVAGAATCRRLGQARPQQPRVYGQLAILVVFGAFAPMAAAGGQGSLLRLAGDPQDATPAGRHERIPMRIVALVTGSSEPTAS
jgi:hypothetical protein